MKKELILAILLLFSYIFVGCSKDEPEPKPEEPEIPTEPTEPETPVIDLYPQLPDGATAVPSKFFTGKYARLPLPLTLRVIQDEGFYACLNKVLVIPEGVVNIGIKGLAKGTDFFGSVNAGNVQYIYLPKTIKKLGENSLKGIWQDRIDYFRGFVSNPIVIFASETPPEGFLYALLNIIDFGSGPQLHDDGMEPQTIYVPEVGLEKYLNIRDKYFSSDNDISGFELRFLRIYSYSPVSIEIIEGTNPARYEYTYLLTSENQGEITGVRWATSDPEIALINAGGVLEPRKVGKTHIQCIVSTPASDGKDIEFYFFKPVEITPDILK